MNKKSRTALLHILLIIAILFALHDLKRGEQQREADMQRIQQLTVEAERLEVNRDDLRRELQEVKYLQDLTEKINVCAPNSTFKSFMDYRKITDTTSAQYKLLESGYTIGSHGILVKDGSFLVAMSSEYGPIGTKLTLELDTVTLNVMIADFKHTGCTSDDGSMLEFVVDERLVYPGIKASGNYNTLFEGVIKEITKQ